MVAIKRLNDPPTWLKVATILENPEPPPTTSVGDDRDLWAHHIHKPVAWNSFKEPDPN